MNTARELLRLLTPVLKRAGSVKFEPDGVEVHQCSYCIQDLDGPEPEGHASWCAIERLQEMAESFQLKDETVQAGSQAWLDEVTKLLQHQEASHEGE